MSLNPLQVTGTIHIHSITVRKFDATKLNLYRQVHVLVSKRGCGPTYFACDYGNQTNS